MRIVKILLILVVIVLLALVAGGLWVNRYIQSEAFKQTVLDVTRQTLGTDVKINQMTVSLLSGAELQGLSIANPTGFEGNLMQAEQFVLRYRLMPLLKKQLHIPKIALVKPRITMVRDARSIWNYEAFLESSPKPATGKTGAGNEPATSATSPLDVKLSELILQNGVVNMIANNKLLVRLSDINLRSSASLAAGTGQLSGQGSAEVAEINMADSLFARGITAPVSISSEQIKLAPLKGVLAKGNVTGDLTLNLTGGFKYIVNLNVSDGDVATLLKEAGAKEMMTGKLQLVAGLEGTGGMDTITGKGHADITGGKLAEIQALSLVAGLLQIPELQGIQFEECRLEFTMANNIMQTPVIRLKARQIQIAGSGSVTLSDYALNHKLTLALENSLLDKVPKEIRGAFKKRDDGYSELEFNVTGPYDKPKTDLAERLVKGAAGGLIDRGLKQLFR